MRVSEISHIFSGSAGNSLTHKTVLIPHILRHFNNEFFKPSRRLIGMSLRAESILKSVLPFWLRLRCLVCNPGGQFNFGSTSYKRSMILQYPAFKDIFKTILLIRWVTLCCPVRQTLLICFMQVNKHCHWTFWVECYYHSRQGFGSNKNLDWSAI